MSERGKLRFKIFKVKARNASGSIMQSPNTEIEYC